MFVHSYIDAMCYIIMFKVEDHMLDKCILNMSSS